METTKTVKYTCSDGKVFYGVENKKEAKLYEEKISNEIKAYKREHAIASLVGAEFIFDNYKDDCERDDIYRSIAHAYMNGTFEDQTQHEIIELFGDPICPEDLDDFSDMAKMIKGVVDNFGGIDVIKKICNLVE